MSKRIKWTPEEDDTLRYFIQDSRAEKPDWERIANRLLSKGIKKQPKQIRERWTQHLHPGVTRGCLTRAERVRLFELQSVLGCHWKQISEHFPGKTDNFVKNVFFAQIRKSLRKAKKLSNFFSNGNSRKMYRPSILSTFLTDEVPIPKNLLNISRSLKWVKNEVVNTREFVLFFSEANEFELQTLRKQNISELIDIVFTYLELLSKNHNINKETNLSNQTAPSLQAHGCENVPLKSVKILGKELLFYFKNLEKDLQGASRKDDVIRIFDQISECASDIKKAIGQTNEINQSIDDLRSLFVGQSPPTSLNLNQEKISQSLGVFSLSQTFYLNPKKSSEKLTNLLEQTESLGLIEKVECSFQNPLSKKEDFSKSDTIIEDKNFKSLENINQSGRCVVHVRSDKDPKS